MAKENRDQDNQAQAAAAVANSAAVDHSRLEDRVLRVLKDNAKISPEELAVMMGTETAAIKEVITQMEKQQIILGYGALIDWMKRDREAVTGLIEVRVTPQRDRGFDRIAQRIYNFPEVNSCYLMSGDYDLLVTVEGHSLRDVSHFVSEKIAVIDEVLSTRTHFILKKYKMEGHILKSPSDDEREVMVL